MTSSTFPDANANHPQMHFDVLLSVTEKLLFSPDNDFRLDLRDPNTDVVNFLFAGSACRWAFFTQFRRLTKLNVNLSEIHLSSPTPIQGVCGLLANNKEFFQGPFVISDNFLYVLICQGVLQPKIVDSFFKFGVKDIGKENMNNANNKLHIEKDKTSHEVDDVTNESPAESLVRLFFFQNSPGHLSSISREDLKNCDLKFDSVKIQDDEAIYKHITRILNLNAERLLLEITSEFNNNYLSNFTRSRIVANRTRTVILSYTIDIMDSEYMARVDFPFDEFYFLLRYIANSCPNLQSMVAHFLLQGEFSDEDFKILSGWLKHTITGFADGQLSNMEFQCDLVIAFRAFFPEFTLMEANKTNHILANIGEPRNFDGDGIEEDVVDLDLPDTFTIARKISIQKTPQISIVYNLVGIEDESTNNDWDGFNGPAVLLPPNPPPGPYHNQVDQFAYNGEDLSD